MALVDQLQTEEFRALLAEVRQSEAWKAFWNYLNDMHVQAYRELRGAQNWEETIHMKGVIGVLEALTNFPTSLQEMLNERIEESEHANR